jgi:hypothetical protein
VKLRGEQKRCVERLVREKGSTCGHCGSPRLVANEAGWVFGGASGGELDVYLKCTRCGMETPLALPPEDYKRCGFDPNQGLR